MKSTGLAHNTDWHNPVELFSLLPRNDILVEELIKEKHSTIVGCELRQSFLLTILKVRWGDERAVTTASDFHEILPRSIM